MVCFGFDNNERRWIEVSEEVVSVCLGQKVESFFTRTGGWTFPYSKKDKGKGKGKTSMDKWGALGR